MRYYELLELQPVDLERRPSDAPRPDGTSEPVLSLQHLHRLKRMRMAHEAERERKRALWGLMYGQYDPARRDLERREADLEAHEREQHLRDVEAGIHKAIADAEIDEESKQHLHAMAMRAIKRERKRT
jgi:hypothetical protein